MPTASIEPDNLINVPRSPRPQRVLVCGHRSFAARGVVPVLRAAGHTVTCFSRGPVARDGEVVTGPIDEMTSNPYLDAEYDALVNYILLKDDTQDRNNLFLHHLLQFCAQRGVRHLIHFSSISSYAATARRITEDAPIETDPARKGSYGSLKVATDQYLLRSVPDGLGLTFLRPGFILGAGVQDPIIAMGARTPWNSIMVIGNPHNRVPVTTRELVHRVVARCLDVPPRFKGEVVLIADTNSPSRREFLEECCRSIGCGTHTVSIPVPLWLLAAVGGEVVARVAGMAVRPYKTISAACRRQVFDSTASEKRLGMSFAVDWRAALRDSLDNQEPNFTLPHRPTRLARIRAYRVAFIGFGAIVKQKHLPGLKKVHFRGDIEAFDPRGGVTTSGQLIQPLENARPKPADLIVVASPGPVHNKALPMLRTMCGPVLVEKPVCYTPQELDEWLEFSRERGGRVYILHNYRFKQNVMRMLAHLAAYNPGRLHHVQIHYQSPSVSKDLPWRREEQRARTLLMDYSSHYLDLAAMFYPGRWEIRDLRHHVNSNRQTSLIEGRIACPEYAVDFVLRQGFIPRRTRMFFTFENYGVGLGFFPDTFVPYMTYDGPALHRMERRVAYRGVARKIFDKLTGGDADDSHALAFLAATGDENLSGSIALERLENFYRLLFEIGQAVYRS